MKKGIVSSQAVKWRKRSHIISLITMMVLLKGTAFAQDIIEVSGVVTSQDRHEPLPGVAISIKGTVAGTTSSNEGSFSLKTKQKLIEYQLFTLKVINSFVAMVI